MAWAPAALALAVFAVVGVAVLDDYDPWVDTRAQRHAAKTALNFVLPGAGDLPADQAIPGVGLPSTDPTERYYGVAFDSKLSVEPYVANESLLMLPAAARRRITGERPPDFYLKRRAGPTFGPVIYARHVYDNPVIEVIAVDLALVDEAAAGHYRAVYRAARAGEPVLRWEFDLYLDGRTLTGVKEPCRPEDTSLRFALQFVPAAAEDLPSWRLRGPGGERGAPAWRGEFDLYLDAAGAVLTYHKEPCAPADLRERFYLHVFPADPAELADAERQSGFYNRSFAWSEHGALFGAACVAPVPLPAYERGVARIRTSQSKKSWRADFPAEKVAARGRPISSFVPPQDACYS